MPPSTTKQPPTAPPEKGTALLTIHPTDVFTAAGAQAALGLTRSTVRREVKEGRLRVSRRAGRYYILGAWLLEWLEGGELSRRPDRNGTHAGRPAAPRETEAPRPDGRPPA